MTEDELLSRWRLRRAIEPQRSDVTIELILPDDGTVKPDDRYRAEMRDWYLKLIDTAEESHLEWEEMANDVRLKTNGDGTATIDLPEACRRVGTVRLSTWDDDVGLTAAESETARRQQSAYTRAGRRHPVVIRRGTRLYIYGTGSGGGPTFLTSLKAVTEKAGTEEDPMIIDERDLATIDTYNDEMT